MVRLKEIRAVSFLALKIDLIDVSLEVVNARDGPHWLLDRSELKSADRCTRKQGCEQEVVPGGHEHYIVLFFRYVLSQSVASPASSDNH